MAAALPENPRFSTINSHLAILERFSVGRSGTSKATNDVNEMGSNGSKSKPIACTICAKSGKHMRPVWYCRTCKIYICVTCRDHHELLFENREHLTDEYPREQNCSMCPKPKKSSLKTPSKTPYVYVPFYCPDCDKFYCGSCLTIHNRYPEIKRHVIIDLGQHWHTLDEDTRDKINDKIRLQNQQSA